MRAIVLRGLHEHPLPAVEGIDLVELPLSGVEDHLQGSVATILGHGHSPHEIAEVVTSADNVHVPVVYVGAVTSADNLAHLWGVHRIRYMLAPGGNFAPDFIATLRRLAGGPLAPPGELLAPGARSTTRSLSSSTDVSSAMEELTRFTSVVPAARRVLRRLLAVAEELMTNALYDAPTGPNGKQLFHSLSRVNPVFLPVGQKITLTCAADERRMALTVEDPYGSMTADRTLNCLSKCKLGGERQVEKTAGGSGLGLYLAYENAHHLRAQIVPRKKTEMTAWFDLARGPREVTGRSCTIFVLGQNC